METIVIANANLGIIPGRRGKGAVKNSYRKMIGTDFITVQEHFIQFSPFQRYRSVSNKICRRDGMHFHQYFKDSAIGTGLITNSRHKIEATDCISWDGQSPFVAKGAGYTQHNMGNGALALFNTHLPTGNGNDAEKALEDLTDFINTVDADWKVVCGDFNYRITNGHVRRLLKETGLTPVGYTERIEFCLVSENVEYVNHNVFAEWDGNKKLTKAFKRKYADHPIIRTRLRLL